MRAREISFWSIAHGREGSPLPLINKNARQAGQPVGTLLGEEQLVGVEVVDRAGHVLVHHGQLAPAVSVAVHQEREEANEQERKQRKKKTHARRKGIIRRQNEALRSRQRMGERT